MPTVNLDIKAAATGTASIKGITKSIISAQIAIEGLKMVTRALIDIGKQSIEKLKQQEQVLNRLAVQTNGNTEAIEEWTAQIQDMTTIGDEVSQSIASLGIEMGITEEKLEDATKGAIGLSEAFRIDLNTSMKMVALANENQYTMLARYIPALRTATDDTEKAAIVQEAMARGFELAKARAETFTGRLDQLKNIQGDNLEAFGRLISIVGTDFVNSMIDAQNGLNDFLNSAQTINNVEIVFDAFLDIMRPFKELFEDLSESIKIGNKEFNALEFAGKTLSTVFLILFKAIELNFKILTDFIKVIKSVGTAASLMWDALVGKKDQKEAAKKALAGILDDFKTIGLSYVDLTKDIIDGTARIWKALPKEIKKPLDDTEKIIKESNDKTKENNDKALSEYEKNQKKMSEIAKQNADRLKQLHDKKQKDSEDFVNEEKVTWQDWANGITNIVKQTMSIISEFRNNFYQNELSGLNEWKESQLSGIDDWIIQEEERLGVREESQQERLNREIEELQNNLTKQSDEKEAALLRDQIKEKQDQIIRLNIKEQADKRKDELDKKAKKKETEIKKKQFEENKAFAIANVWINAASAIMGFWAAYATIPIAGPIIAGVLTAAALILAGVQTGLIASQTFHGQEGGLFPTGTTTGDNAAMVLWGNKGEALFKNDTYNGVVKFINDYMTGTFPGLQPVNVNVYLDDYMIGRIMIDKQKNDRIR